MRGGITVELTGIRELESKFKQLSEKLIKRALKRAISAGAEIIREDAARRIFPYSKTTNVIQKVVSRKSGSIEVGIGPEKPYWWSRFIELGHDIYATTRAGGKIRRRRHMFAQVIGKVPAHPWLRPAMDENQDKIVAAIAAEFQKEIREVCK